MAQALLNRPSTSAHTSLIFNSVFPVSSLAHTTPTPIATPNLSSSAAGQSFGGFAPATPDQHGLVQNLDAGHVKRSLAWSTATRFLSLSGTEVVDKTKGRDVAEALNFLLAGQDGVEGGEGEGSLVEWFTNDARRHFNATFLPRIQEIYLSPIECEKAWHAVEKTLWLLGKAQSFYLRPWTIHIVPILRAADKGQRSHNRQGRSGSEEAEWKFRRDLNTMFSQSIFTKRFSDTLSFVFYDAGCKGFRLHEDPRRPAADILHVKQQMNELLNNLYKLGLDGNSTQLAYAHGMDRLMTEFIESYHMKVDWYGKQAKTAKLRLWVTALQLMVVQFMSVLKIDREGDKNGSVTAGKTETQRWQDMAIGRLGRARIHNLFDYIMHWDNSIGAVLDIKDCMSTNADRAYLVVSFTGQLYRRLLRAGATTTHILDMYIYVIRAFKELDPKGVLLDRVAQPIRRYLKDRTDTARIIVSSLLADIHDENGDKIDHSEDISIEIAAEMQKPISAASNEHDDDLNWGDLTWTPEPVDASVDYRSSKTSDIISYLLTLFEREDLISELKNILGDHLLKNEDSDFDKEIRLLELFKLRLGDTQLQPCDVMLRDVLDSKRLNQTIATSHPSQPPVRAQVLSSFFWPPLRDDAFHLPRPVQQAQARYAAGFEAIKDMRKLHWLPALGKVDIELHLADRTVAVECTTWQAAVIHAFQDPAAAATGTPVSRSVEQLSEELEMENGLVQQALTHWVALRVLAPHASLPGSYTVLERLPTSASSKSLAAVAAAQEASEQAANSGTSGVVTAEDLLDRNKSVYETFIVGMLTNQGGLTRARILMMLKMAVPGGFPGGVEEVGGVLEGLRAEGRVERGGGDVWVVVKK